VDPRAGLGAVTKKIKTCSYQESKSCSTARSLVTILTELPLPENEKLPMATMFLIKQNCWNNIRLHKPNATLYRQPLLHLKIGPDLFLPLPSQFIIHSRNGMTNRFQFHDMFNDALPVGGRMSLDDE
jgi:hypothetical protein